MAVGTVVSSTPASPVSAGHDDPVLIGDINRQSGDSDPEMFVTVGDDVYFAAFHPDSGYELWVHETGSDTTRLVRDITPGPVSTYMHHGIALGDRLYFIVDDGVHGDELWTSDGTEAGTVSLGDRNPGPDSGALAGYTSDMVAFDGKVFFPGTNGTATGLWSYDPVGGFVLHDEFDEYPVALTVAGGGTGQLFFAAGSDDAYRLYRYDTSGSTSTHVDIEIESDDIELLASGTELYIRATGDTAGIYRLANIDIEPFAGTAITAVDTSGYPARPAAVHEGGIAYYRGALTWVAPGGAPTTVAGTESAYAGDTQPVVVVPRGGDDSLALFTGPDDSLWLGSSSAAFKVQDYFPGSDDPFHDPDEIATSPYLGNGNVVAYWMRPPGDADPQLQRLFLGLTGPAAIDPNPVTSITGGTPSFVYGNGAFWFPGHTVGAGTEPMRLSDTAPMAAVLRDINADTAASHPDEFTALGEVIVFTATDGVHGNEPWAYDPATGTTTLLADTNDSNERVRVAGVVGGRAILDVPGAMWVTDGTPAGTFELGESFGIIRVDESDAILDGKLLVSARVGSEQELWATDGTVAGTSMIVDVSPGDSSFPGNMTVVDDLVYFSARDGVANSEPWVSDGTQDGTVKLVEARAGVDGSYPSHFTPVGDWVYFTAAQQIWRTDGTPGNTSVVSIGAGPPGEDVDGFAVLDGRLVVQTRVYADGSFRHFVTDGTAAGTDEFDLLGGMNLNLDEAVEFDGRLLTHGRTVDDFSILVATDGTAAGSEVLDLLDGQPDTSYSLVGTHGGWLYFMGSSPSTGWEIWRSDATVAGTAPLTDLQPGSGDSLDRDNDGLVAEIIGDELYFAGVADGIGVEPHVLDLTEHPDVPAIVPVDPARIWDSRSEATFDHQFSNTGRLADGTSATVHVAGRGAIPDDAVGIVANLTVIYPDGPGFATIYPCGDLPTASTVNYFGGDVLANNVTVPLDPSGDICVYTLRGAHYALDVNGYVPHGSPVTGVTPARYLDTRGGADTTFDTDSAGSGPVAARTSIEVPIAGRGSVPADATAAIVNVTSIFPDAPGYLTLYPCDTVPDASNLNYLGGDVTPNGAITRLSPTGTLCIYTLATTHLALDVSGYVPTAVDSITTMTPARLTDTREPADANTGRIPAGGHIEIQVTGRAGIPADATAAIFNLGAVFPDGPGFLTIYPCGERPLASNLNHATGNIVRANNAVTKLSAAGTVCVYTHAATDVILDTTGYLT